MGEVLTVVGLGPVPSDVVASVLGPDVRFVQTPDDVDLRRAKGAIVRAAVKIGSSELDAMPDIRVIARTGVGVDDIDVDTASSRGIPVAVTPGVNSTAVAEGALAHILHLVKSLGPLTELVRSERWSARSEVPVGDLEGATLGLVGYGNIGKRVKALAEAFGMNVKVYDPIAEVPSANRAGTLDEVLSIADIISLHVPLNESTRRMIDARAIDQMKPGTVLVNTSRGGLIDEDAALSGLESGKLAGVGLDSFDPEPPRPHPLHQHPRTVLTPHVMGLTTNSSRATFIAAAQAVRDVLDGGGPAAAVNAADLGLGETLTRNGAK